MVILKKIVIMTEHGKSNCSGIVKFENFAGRTSCFVRILGLKGDGVICIKCADEIMYCGAAFEGEHKFNALYDLNKRIRIAAVRDGEIVSLGSSKGKFLPNEILPDIHRYFAGIAETQQQTGTQTIAADNIMRSVEVETVAEDIADVKSEPEVIAEVAAEEETIAVEEAVQSKPAPVKKTKSVSAVKVKAQPQEPFYKKIEDNMQQLFEKNDPDEELALLMPGSKWARVSLGDDGYYVVGIIYNEDVPEIICYGVPDKDGSNPPQNEENCRQWMEIEKGGRGYWMMYQSAKTGETLTDR